MLRAQLLTRAACCALLLGSAASADVIGLQFDDGTPVTIDGVDYISYALYAISDDVEDVIIAILGLGTEIGVDAAYWSNDVNSPHDGAGSGFYNHALGGDLPAPADLVKALPDLQWDTMLTIGQDNGDPATSDDVVAQLAPDTGIDLSGPGPTIMSPDNGGLGSIFITPDQPVGHPDAEGRVLLGRFTVQAGESISVGMNIQWSNFAGRGGGVGYFETLPLPGLPPEDLNGDEVVDVFDLLELLANWGTVGAGADIAAPLNIVDVNDLLGLLAAWGPVI